jgi:hypothetical protein
MSPHAATIRAAKPSDREALARLTTIGNRRYLPGLDLVAELNGAVLAAISLTTGAVAADLGHAYPLTIRRLRYRRYQILRQGGDVGVARMALRRLAPAAAGSR